MPVGGIAQCLVAGLCLAGATSRADVPYAPVMVYYDQATPADNDGKIGANALRNLLGHFKTSVDVTNVASYTAGQLNRYWAVFYIGSVSSATNVPTAFINDVMGSTTTVVWLHYNLWLLPGFTSGTNRFGIHYDWGNADVPGYDTVNYKGEWLYKYGTLTRISVSNFVQQVATATSRANPTNPALPYVVRSGNFWYVADNSPRSQVLADRSLVLADLLHDILGTGTNFALRALARIEDNAPALTSKTAISAASAALRDLGVSATFGIIPRYRDPTGKYTNQYPADIKMSENRDFQRTLRTVLRNGGAFADHGYTHESGDAESGSGYEFWNATNGTPLAYDTWDWCAGRVTNGLTEMASCGFPTPCWETVHYEASLVDYFVFADTYRYSHERARVFSVFGETLARTNLDAISITNPPYTDQWFPYVIHRSAYGNMFLPENLDRDEPTVLDSNGLLLTVSNKVDYARKFRVVRDAVAGFYYHPGHGTTNLASIVTQMQGLGYTFTGPIDLSYDDPVRVFTNDDWAASNTVRTIATATNLIADLVVGDAGAGNSLGITNGAVLAAEGALLGATSASCSNLVSVAGPGSAWLSRRTIAVGGHGASNQVVVSGGGQVMAPETVIGLSPESAANAVTLTDPASGWSNHYGFIVGRTAPSNTLLATAGSRISGLYGEIGAASNASLNAVTITGAGTLWSNSQYLVVGNAGAGNSLAILSSGRVVGASGFIGARNSAFSNAVTVSGPGSCWSNSAGLMVGIDARYNTLTLTNGGRANCASAVVGNYDNGNGNRIDIQGGNATLTVQQGLTIGYDGFANVVQVGPGGVLQCGALTVSADPGYAVGNMLVVTGGTATVTGTVRVANGAVTVAAGTLSAGQLVVQPGGTLSVATGAVLQGSGMLTNQGTVVVPPGFVFTHTLTWDQGGTFAGGDSNTFNLAAGFACTSTNADLLRTRLAFSTGTVHALSMSSVDRGPSLAGFHNNQALGTLSAAGTVQISGTVYAWTLSGTGVVQILPGGRFYYVTTEGWSGSVQTNLTGTATMVPVALAGVTRLTNAAVRLSWPSAASLSVGIDWSAILAATNFVSATNFVATGTNTVWDDKGATNRPAPSVTTQRFYRLRMSP